MFGRYRVAWGPGEFRLAGGLGFSLLAFYRIAPEFSRVVQGLEYEASMSLKAASGGKLESGRVPVIDTIEGQPGCPGRAGGFREGRPR
jgi:hypothetical protein